MRYLLISLSLLSVSCASYPEKNGFESLDKTVEIVNNPYFTDPTRDYVYKAKIEAFGKFLGGIFIVKKLGQAHHRFVFTTEMGNKIFDFTLDQDHFKSNYMLPGMDKKMFVKLLKRDLKILVRETSVVFKGFNKNATVIYEVGAKKEKYFYVIEGRELHKILRVKGRKEKMEFIFSKINDNIVGQIQIIHHDIPLKIDLKTI